MRLRVAIYVVAAIVIVATIDVAAAILVMTIARVVLYAMAAWATVDTMAVMTTSHTGRAVAWIAEVTTIPAIMHSKVLSVGRTEVTSVAVVVAMCTMQVPGMSTTICSIEVRTSEVEEITMRIYAVDAKVPVSSLPVQWAIEVRSSYVSIPLPVEEDIAQIEISALPISAKYIVAA
jgi:hypothetical protein